MNSIGCLRLANLLFPDGAGDAPLTVKSGRQLSLLTAATVDGLVQAGVKLDSSLGMALAFEGQTLLQAVGQLTFA